MVDQRHSLGQDSEKRAEEWFLKNRNCELIIRNFRCRWGEIDLIFEEVQPQGQLELVFVEVRARVQKVWVDGPASVDWKKQKKLLKTASYFLSNYKGLARSVRFDLLHWNGKDWEYLPHLWMEGY